MAGQQLTGSEVIQSVLGQDGNGSYAASTETLSLLHINGAGTRVTTSTTNFVSTTTLGNVTGLSIGGLVGNRTYTVKAAIPLTSGSSGGVQLALNTSDTLTMTSMNLTGKFFTAAGLAVVNTTTFAGGVGTTATVILAELVGSFVTNAGGTLIVQAAQNASNGTTTALLANGYIELNKVT